MYTKAATWMIGIALALATLPGAAQDYVLHGRVSYDAGNTLVKGAEDSEYGYATTNTLILPGDTLWVDQGGASEVEFAGGSFLRVADGSKVEIVALPPNGTVRMWTGSLYMHRLSRSTGGFVVQTPAATVEVGSDAQVRVDVVDQGATTVTVRWGRAEIRTDQGGSTIVGAGQRAWVDPGYWPSEAVAFDRNREDAFDQWNRERAEFLVTGGGASTGPQTTPVINEPVIGASELARYGEWVYVDSRPYWRPTVIVDYVPYRYGRWNYVPRYGHVWSGHYPFSYVTSHYGRWRHTSTYGWIWSYDPVWSPAWVASVRVGDYFVWAPVDYHYRPVLVSGHSYFSVGGVRFSFFSTSYAPATGIYYGSSYIHPVHTGFYRYVNDRHRDIHIWNININTNRRVPVPYDNSLTRVRDYNPNRSIRSSRSFQDGGPLAVDRARSLETRAGRSQFTSVDRTGGRGARTVVDSGARDSRVRDVRLTREAPSFTRATADRPEVASREAVRSVRGGGAGAVTPRSAEGRGEGRTSRDLVEAPGRSVGATGRTPEDGVGRGTRGDAPGRDGAVRTPRPQVDSTDAARDRAVGGRTSPAEGARPDRSTVRDGGGRSTTTAPVETGAPARSVRPDAGERTPARGSAPTVGDTRSFRPEDQPGRSGDSVRSPGTTPRSPQTTEPRVAPTTPERSPAIRGNRVEGAPTPRIEQRTPSAPQRTPSVDRSGPAVRETAPNVQRSTPTAPSVQQRGPAVRESAPNVRQSAPSVQRTAPNVQQSAPTVRQSAPNVQQSAPTVRQQSAPGVQRSAPPVRQSAPSVQQSAPSVQRSAPPVRQSAPSIQRSAPSAPSVQRSAPDVQRSAPSAPQVRQSAPNVQRSAPSAPSVQRSAPSVQRSAPSVQRSAPDVSRGASPRGGGDSRRGR